MPKNTDLVKKPSAGNTAYQNKPFQLPISSDLYRPICYHFRMRRAHGLFLSITSVLVERMYQQVVARPTYPNVYSMGLSIVKTQLQNMHEKNQKRKLKPRI